MSLISQFCPPCQSWLYVEGELIWPRSSSSIHKYFLSMGGDLWDPWSLISGDIRLDPMLIQCKELFLQNRFFSSFLIKHIMCFFIILFQLWIHYLHPGVPTEDSLWDGMIWGWDILCHINMTSERFLNKLFRECYKQKKSTKRRKSSILNPLEHSAYFISNFSFVVLCSIFFPAISLSHLNSFFKSFGRVAFCSEFQ